MMYPSAYIPPNEAERLKVVQLYAQLPLRRPIFQAMVRLTAAAFMAPMSIVSIVEATEVQYPGSVGLKLPARMPRIDCICSAAVYTHATTIFNDLQQYPCPWVSLNAQAQTDFSFYAGTPLLTGDDFAIGTLCILDNHPREFPATHQGLLRVLARLAIYLLDLHRLALAYPNLRVANWDELEERLVTATTTLHTMPAPEQQPHRQQLVFLLKDHIESVYSITSYVLPGTDF